MTIDGADAVGGALSVTTVDATVFVSAENAIVGTDIDSNSIKTDSVLLILILCTTPPGSWPGLYLILYLLKKVYFLLRVRQLLTIDKPPYGGLYYSVTLLYNYTASIVLLKLEAILLKMLQ